MADLLALAERQPKIAWGTLARALLASRLVAAWARECLAHRSMALCSTQPAPLGTPEVIIPEQLSEASAARLESAVSEFRHARLCTSI